MSTYAIGDVQGCYAELRSLLRACGFDARRDRLWFAGDLVNRGPNSLDVLRFAADFGDRAHVVLGNHDLHLVASARGIRKPRARDTFHDVLDAADGEALIDWLRARPMIHHDPERACVMVHAGIPPAWTIADAIGHGGELSRALRAPNHPQLVAHLYGNKPDEWRDALAGFDRLRFIANAFTRMRYCHADGRLDFSETRPPGDQDPSLTPWFMLRDGGVDRVRIVFGHWATLRLRTAPPAAPARPSHRHRMRMGRLADRVTPRRRSGIRGRLRGRRAVKRLPAAAIAAHRHLEHVPMPGAVRPPAGRDRRRDGREPRHRTGRRPGRAPPCRFGPVPRRPARSPMKPPSIAPAIAIVAATAGNRVIGRGGGLPWRLPADLARFRALTMGKPIVMGRRTHESIGRGPRRPAQHRRLPPPPATGCRDVPWRRRSTRRWRRRQASRQRRRRRRSRSSAARASTGRPCPLPSAFISRWCTRRSTETSGSRCWNPAHGGKSSRTRARRRCAQPLRHELHRVGEASPRIGGYAADRRVAGRRRRVGVEVSASAPGGLRRLSVTPRPAP